MWILSVTVICVVLVLRLPLPLPCMLGDDILGTAIGVRGVAQEAAGTA